MLLPSYCAKPRRPAPTSILLLLSFSSTTVLLTPFLRSFWSLHTRATLSYYLLSHISLFLAALCAPAFFPFCIPRTHATPHSSPCCHFLQALLRETLKHKTKEYRNSRRRLARLRKRAAGLDDAALLDIIRMRSGDSATSQPTEHATGTAEVTPASTGEGDALLDD